MRTFAQKRNQLQNPAPASLVKPQAAPPGLDQRTLMGHRAEQRMLQTQPEAFQTGSSQTVSPRIGHDFSQIPIHPPPAGAISQSSLSTDDKKAELEFHSTIAFNRTHSGSSSSGPSEEGFTGLEFQWTVWNAGWEAAPEHIDRVTMVQADRCSGCRDEKDEILRMEVPAPATVPITQRGEGAFKYEAISPLVGMTLRAGHYDVYVDLDVYDEVQEINEDNNTIFTTFFVKPRPKSDPDEEAT